MRDLDSGFQTQIEARALRCCLLTKAEFDSGDVNMFTGTGEIEFNGDTYLGGGILLAITTIEETQELKAINVSYTLSGVPSSMLSLALGERINKRPITTWFGVIDDENHLFTEEIYSGYMDTMPIEDDIENGEATITLNTESDLQISRLSVDRNYTPEDQKLYEPGDLFFDFVPTIQDIEINWGPPT